MFFSFSLNFSKSERIHITLYFAYRECNIINSVAVLLSAKKANLMDCKATQVNSDLLNTSMSALLKIILTKVSIHTAFCSKNHQNRFLVETCSIACLSKINPPFIQKIPVDSILYLPHTIYQTSCRLSNGFNDTHARFIN